MPIMPYSKKPIVNYFMYGLYAIIMAVVYGLFTYFGFLERSAYSFALRNLLLIALVLLIDKIYLATIKKNAEKRKAANRKSKVLHFISFKASLYLFYIFTLTFSRLMLLLDFTVLGWEVEAVYNFGEYLRSMEYGLIVLVAADKFIDQFIKDKKQMKEIAAG